MKQAIKIGTRDSQLAVWQATLVQNLLHKKGTESELVYIKSEGDIDTVTPLYELGVQGIFTKSLDTALLNRRIDIAVHSLKDVPTKLPDGIVQAAVLERGSYKDVLVYKDDWQIVSSQLGFLKKHRETSRPQPAPDGIKYQAVSADLRFIIATSSIRRKAQWLHRYPHHTIENLRGNVNTRLQKLQQHNWNGAIFAAAGLERINLRPENSIDIDWMLPAPAQGAVTIVCRADDRFSLGVCSELNHNATELCTKIERDFLRALLGGCSTPISALALIENHTIIFKGNICSPDGAQKTGIEKKVSISDGSNLGINAAAEILANGGAEIMKTIGKRIKIDGKI